MTIVLKIQISIFLKKSYYKVTITKYFLKHHISNIIHC